MSWGTITLELRRRQYIGRFAMEFSRRSRLMQHYPGLSTH